MASFLRSFKHNDVSLTPTPKSTGLSPSYKRRAEDPDVEAFEWSKETKSKNKIDRNDDVTVATPCAGTVQYFVEFVNINQRLFLYFRSRGLHESGSVRRTTFNIQRCVQIITGVV
jgi:hypothetical protein